LVRQVFRGTARWGDYGVVAMVRLLVGLLVVGGRRLRHVAYAADDPLFRRFAGLSRLPTARTISRWLKQFTMTLRFEVFHRAPMLVRPGGITQLRLANNAATRQRFERIEKAVARGA
jgi:hypothetical protein